MEVAHRYEQCFAHVQLIEAIIDAPLVDNARPGKAHQAFVQLPFDPIYTTDFGLYLEGRIWNENPILLRKVIVHIYPTDEEIQIAADCLVNKYKVSSHLLGDLFNKEQRDQANLIMQSLGGNRLKPIDVARLLIQREGPELFVGSQKATQELRLHILQKLPDAQIKSLFEQHSKTNNNKSSPKHMRRPLAEKKWYSGKDWANDFVAATGFPTIFAGIEKAEKVPTIIDVSPRETPPKLANFQIELKKRMLDVLERDGHQTRCVVTLPTGGGKTRVAVEAFIDWMQPRFAAGKYLIWIAQSEELCEQAIACIEQMWKSREFVSSLRIYRFFGGRDIPGGELRGGTVVASIQQLYKRIGNNDPAIGIILKDTGAMIIDEAHRAISQMYDKFLDKAKEVCGPDLFPICGLTATPGRSGINSAEETVKLVGRFDAYLAKPILGEEYEKNPLQYFRDHQYLARAFHVQYCSGIEYSLTDKELEEMQLANDLPPKFLKRLATDKERNLLILRRLLKIPKGTSTLVYACTVDHAYFLSAILTAQGRKSGAISSDTPITLRRALIRDFKEQKLELLCNYGVLTTGFDAPKTEYIVLCRPTTSEVLYEQIIGRGLRGPKFGGTPSCTIIDFADNIRRLGPPLAYARFDYLWNENYTEQGKSFNRL